jgi:hypothetical protein
METGVYHIGNFKTWNLVGCRVIGIVVCYHCDELSEFI